MAFLSPMLLPRTAAAPRARWRTVLALLVLLLGADSARTASTAVSKEYQVKAAFLYNFSQFVEWPTEALPVPESPLVIGILGDDPFDGYLDELVRGEKVNNHPLVVQRFRRAEDIKACHILFISQSENRRLDQILFVLAKRSVLTVGDFESFAKRGGMVRFVTENNKIRFRINVDTAKAANLTISSKLLKAAEIVDNGKD